MLVSRVHLISMLVLRALLGFSFVQLLRQSLAHFQDSLIVLRALIEFFFVGLLRKYLLCVFRILSLLPRAILGSHLIGFLRENLECVQDSHSFDCYVIFQYLEHFQDFFHAIVTLVSRVLLGFSFCRLLRQSLVHIQDLGKSVMNNLQSKEIVS